FPETYIAPRGLVTILLFFQIPDDLIRPEVKPGILLYVIILTSVVMTYYLIKDKMIRDKNNQEEGNEPVAVVEEAPPKLDPVETYRYAWSAERTMELDHGPRSAP